MQALRLPDYPALRLFRWIRSFQARSRLLLSTLHQTFSSPCRRLYWACVLEASHQQGNRTGCGSIKCQMRDVARRHAVDETSRKTPQELEKLREQLRDRFTRDGNEYAAQRCHRNCSAFLRVFPARRLNCGKGISQRYNPAASGTTVGHVSMPRGNRRFQNIRQKTANVSSKCSSRNFSPPVRNSLFFGPISCVHGTATCTNEFVCLAVRHRCSNINAE